MPKRSKSQAPFGDDLHASFVPTICFLLALSACDTWRIDSRLEETPGIAAVTDYLVYEGRVIASVSLDDGGNIDLEGLTRQSFEATDTIYVTQIGNIHISCSYPNQIGTTVSGHNILALIDQLDPKEARTLKISSVPGLIDNYRYALSVIQTLPEKGQPGTKISFTERQPTEWTCFKVVLTDD